MNHATRRGILFVALAGVVGWSAWLAVNDSDPVEAEEAGVELAAPPVQRPPASPVPALLPPVKSADIEPRLALSNTNLFPSQTWYIPPPPPPPPPPQAYVPPPPPQAPPLPFTYMGRWQEAGETTYYLARGTLPVSVRPGQVIEGVWKLETASNGILNFTYLPLNQTRSLRTGE